VTKTPEMKYPIGARAATTAVFLANGSGIGAWAAAIPSIKQALHLSDAALGVGLLAFAAGAMLTMPLAGWLGVRFGSHRLTILAGIAFGTALLLPGLASTLPALIVAMLVLGASNGMMDVAMNAHATAVQRVWNSAIMSSFHAAFSLGGLLGAAGVGMLLSLGLGVSTCLAVAAAWVGAIVLAASLAGLSRDLGAASMRTEGAPGFAWPDASLLGIGLLAFLSMLIEGAVADWSGVFLATVAGASAADAAAGYAAFSIAMVAGRLLGDRFVRNLGRVQALRLGAGLTAFGIAVALVFGQVGGIIGFALVGLGMANAIPVLFTAAGRVKATAPSVGVAMAATLGYSGFLAGPPIIGFIAEAVGLRLALTILFLAAMIVAALAGRALART
jgi:MFS family permease